jgi:hypothetical protein
VVDCFGTRKCNRLGEREQGFSNRIWETLGITGKNLDPVCGVRRYRREYLNVVRIYEMTEGWESPMEVKKGEIVTRAQLREHPDSTCTSSKKRFQEQPLIEWEYCSLLQSAVPCALR